MTTAEEHFTLKFDGEALNEHTMSVEQLAPALLALGRTFQAAKNVAAPSQPQTDLSIKVTREGSFAVDLFVHVPTLIDNVVALLSSRQVDAALKASELVGLTWASVKFIKWMKGRSNLTTAAAPQDHVTITDEHGESITVPTSVLPIVRDEVFRRNLEAFTAPLEVDGIDSISLSGGEGELVIEEADRAAFIVPEPEEVEVAEPSVGEVVLRIDNLAFLNGNKWKFNDGERAFYATISDLRFLARVENGEEQFTATDKLRVRLKTTQTRTRGNALKFDREILEVLDHTHGTRQIPLPFDLPE